MQNLHADLWRGRDFVQPFLSYFTTMVPDVSTRCLETLVAFAYSREIDFTGCDPSAIWPLLCACSELQMPDALHLCNKFLEATTSHNCSNSNQRKLTSCDNNDDNDDVSLRHIRNEAKRKRGRPSVGAITERRPKKVPGEVHTFAYTRINSGILI